MRFFLCVRIKLGIKKAALWAAIEYFMDSYLFGNAFWGCRILEAKN